MNLEKLNRKREREIIVLSLYSLYLSENDIYETVHYVLEQNQIEETATDYIYNSIQGVLNHVIDIDAIIQKNLENYSLDRLAYMDLIIVRFATYELLYAEEIHFAVIINEALEITKKYSDLGDNKATAFNNRLLDTIRNDLQK